MKKLCCCLLALAFLMGAVSCTAKDPSNTPETTDQGEQTSATQEKEDHGTVILQYDDRYSFGEEIQEVRNTTITSRQISEQAPDTAVLQIADQTAGSVIAVGTGSAEVVLKNGAVVPVEVRSASLRMLFLFGQSNAEGMTVGADETVTSQARSQSVLCKEGTVYSTYAPATATYGSYIGGVHFSQDLSIQNASSFVASSLTSEENLLGNKLEYPLNQLTGAGNGKSGLDSSVAYEWNRRTGEKVWVINAAHSGSNIPTWQPGNEKSDNNFWQAVEVANACLSVMQKEVACGHYTFAGLGYFWLQGCADKSMSSERYTELYLNMHNGFEKYLSAEPKGENAEKRIDFAGILLVRHPVSSLTPLDLYLNGPRTAQIFMGTSVAEPYSNIYLASCLGDRFVTDRGVEEYFAEKYPSGKMDFEVRNAYPLPITAATTHPDIHYRQPGYNALGMDAVGNILDAIRQQSGDAAVRVLRPDGYHTYDDQSELLLKAGEQISLAALTADASMLFKGITFVSDVEGITVSCNTLTVEKNVASGTRGTLKIYLGEEPVFQLQLLVQ